MAFPLIRICCASLSVETRINIVCQFETLMENKMFELYKCFIFYIYYITRNYMIAMVKMVIQIV